MPSILTAVVRAIVIALLICTFLGVLLRFFFPQVIDDPTNTNFIGIGVWFVSIVFGALDGVTYYRKCKKQPPTTL